MHQYRLISNRFRVYFVYDEDVNVTNIVEKKIKLKRMEDEDN